MDEREQKRRERAYKIWEDEGRVDGLHEDHWKRAGEQPELGDTGPNQEENSDQKPVPDNGDGRQRSRSAGAPPALPNPD